MQARWYTLVALTALLICRGVSQGNAAALVTQHTCPPDHFFNPDIDDCEHCPVPPDNPTDLQKMHYLSLCDRNREVCCKGAAIAVEHKSSPAVPVSTHDVRVEGGSADRSGGGSVDRSGGGSVDRSGGGSVDRSGGGSVDRSGGGSVDRSGGGSVDRSGGGSVDRSEGGGGGGILTLIFLLIPVLFVSVVAVVVRETDKLRNSMASRFLFCRRNRTQHQMKVIASGGAQTPSAVTCSTTQTRPLTDGPVEQEALVAKNMLNTDTDSATYDFIGP